MKKVRILVIDDEVNVVRYIAACLRRDGYEVSAAGDGQNGLRMAEQENPVLVILDIKMPQMDGFEVCRRLREWTQTPIIMLSAIGEEKDKVKCLNLGADDYITKPFGIEELLARVKAVLRRFEASAVPPVSPAFTSADLTISFAERRVTFREKEIKLTPTEYNLLQELALNRGKVLTYAHLLNKVWGPEYKDEKEYLHVYIGRLRSKLDNPKEPKYIVSIPGVGYRFESVPA